ncbi:MAG: hypothetical protein KF729_35505 [Sandaracinaceae bacterium]|nr:hypothetical protein [Sandaracinaceae bacterium]
MHVYVTVLVDSQKAGHQKLTRLVDDGLLDARRTLMVGQVLGKSLSGGGHRGAWDVRDTAAALITGVAREPR